jgi:hypothetical protein
LSHYGLRVAERSGDTALAGKNGDCTKRREAATGLYPFFPLGQAKAVSMPPQSKKRRNGVAS